jgi:hypothetical protein
MKDSFIFLSIILQSFGEVLNFRLLDNPSFYIITLTSEATQYF